MKILFDNGTPRPIARSLAGHEVTLARRIGWHELKNGELHLDRIAAAVNAALPGSYTEVEIPYGND